MFIKKAIFLVALFTLTFSVAQAEHPIEKNEFLEIKDGDIVVYTQITNETSPNYRGPSALYTTDYSSLNHGKHPVFHPYHPDSNEWKTLANINLIPGTALFHDIVEQNPNLLQLMYNVSEKNPQFDQNHNNESFKVKIVIQEITPRDLPYDSVQNPLAFRPQYYTVPHAQANAINAADAIGQLMRVAFLPVDGLPLTIVKQFPRAEIPATEHHPLFPELFLETRASGETFQTSVSIHPQNPHRKAADGITPAPLLNNILSGPTPGMSDFLQHTIDGNIKPRAIWSVLYQTSQPKYSNPIATLHILVPPELADHIKMINGRDDVNTFEDFLNQTNLFDILHDQDEQLKILPIDFDSFIYLRLNKDLEAYTNTLASNDQKIEFAIWHYLTHGKIKGRPYKERLPADFEPLTYIHLNPDLKIHANTLPTDNEKIEFAKSHYLNFGKIRGRLYK